MDDRFMLSVWQPADIDALRVHLAQLADEKYRAFHAGLVPGIGTFYGVRTPQLRALAQQIAKGNAPGFLALGPDESYEMRILYGFVTGFYRWPYEAAAIGAVRAFVPYINNWAVCDMGTAACKQLAKYPARGFSLAEESLCSAEPCTVRFGVVAILDYYLTPAYLEKSLGLLAEIKSPDYYVKMAVAWAFSVAFVKDREQTLAALPRLTDDFIYNKALQKCIESFRVSNADKNLLKTMKRPRVAKKERE